MIRFLKIGRFGLLKKIRIGVSLLRLSIKSVFFEHNRYFIYCSLLAVVQFIILLSTGFVHSKLRLSLMITESLAGLNFFEVLFESVNQIKNAQVLLLGLLLCIELFFIYSIYSAVSWFIKERPRSILKSFIVAAKKSKQLACYALLETIILLICALLGGIGNLIYFGWQFLTVFNIQLITFESVTFLNATVRSTRYFLKNFAQVLSIDALLEFTIIVIMSSVYYFSQKPLLEPIKTISENYFVAFFLLYLLSILYVLETVTFTLLYIAIKENRN